MTVLADAPAVALAVFAHPDDPEVACAGTLARWSAAGCEVHLVIANRGEKGTIDPTTFTTYDWKLVADGQPVQVVGAVEGGRS